MQQNTIQPEEKGKIMPFVATWIELEILILSEVSQKDKCSMYHLQVAQMNQYTKQKQTHRRGEQTCGCHGEGREKDRLGVWGW